LPVKRPEGLLRRGASGQQKLDHAAFSLTSCLVMFSRENGDWFRNRNAALVGPCALSDVVADLGTRPWCGECPWNGGRSGLAPLQMSGEWQGDHDCTSAQRLLTRWRDYISQNCCSVSCGTANARRSFSIFHYFPIKGFLDLRKSRQSSVFLSYIASFPSFGRGFISPIRMRIWQEIGIGSCWLVRVSESHEFPSRPHPRFRPVC
jgi:hypothetical protein